VLAMSARGRRPRWSEKDRERVLALAAEGASQREIAKAVFGDARYRGRVERMLRAEEAASNGPQAARKSDEDEPVDDPVHPGSDLELFRELVLRAERAMLRSETAPSLADVERLLRIKRQLNAIEMVERANAIARGTWEPEVDS